METLKAIIFDMDGTLADTEDIHRRAFNAAFMEQGLTCHWDAPLYRQLLRISGGRERLVRYLGEQHPELPEEEIQALALKLHVRKSALYRELLHEQPPGLRPGVRRLIEEARQRHIALAIATSSSLDNVETLLGGVAGLPLLDYFSAIVTCDVIAEKKPSPAAYVYALALLGLEPSDCVAIEDTRNGNLAATAAGLATIITTHAYTLDDDFEGAALIVDSLGEPDRPITASAGNSHGRRYVDIPLLDTLLVERLPDADQYNDESIAAE